MCVLGLYEFGWARSMHDWILFKFTMVGKDCIRGKYLLYKLIGDCAYLVQPWVYCPFKGCVNGLEPYKVH